MNKFVNILTFVLLITVPGFAEGSQQEELRQVLGIDYSMPDFSTSKIDGEVIGTRLAKMLQLLMNCQNDFTYKRMLSAIQAEQMEELRYVEIDKFKINKISKRSDELTILIQTSQRPNSAEKRKSQILIHFVAGLPKSKTLTTSS